MFRRLLVLPAVLVLAVAACEDSDVTPPAETQAVLSELELAQLADLEEYVGMIRSGVDPTSPEARAVNARIMERFPARVESRDRDRSREEEPAAGAELDRTPVIGIGEPQERTVTAPGDVGSGPAGQIMVPDDFGSIADAIVFADPGGEVVVRPGVYDETVVLDGLRDITIYGVDAEIHGFFQLDGDDLTVAGFTFTDASDGLFLRNGEGNAALSNVVDVTFDGIWLINSFGGMMAGNAVYGGRFGLRVIGRSSNGDGASVDISADPEDGSDDNTVAANVVDGLTHGIILRA